MVRELRMSFVGVKMEEEDDNNTKWESSNSCNGRQAVRTIITNGLNKNMAAEYRQDYLYPSDHSMLKYTAVDPISACYARGHFQQDGLQYRYVAVLDVCYEIDTATKVIDRQHQTISRSRVKASKGSGCQLLRCKCIRRAVYDWSVWL